MTLTTKRETDSGPQSQPDTRRTLVDPAHVLRCLEEGELDDGEVRVLLKAVCQALVLERERLWTVDDVAHYLGASRAWVYQRDDLPRVDLFRRPRFIPAQVRDYVRRRAGRARLISGGKRR